MPAFVARALKDAGLADAYEARPPYQRNDYLGWIDRAKQESTKQRRLAQMLDELRAGNVYMKMDWGGGRTKAPPSATPKLLSGGNPQIPKGDGHEVVQAYLDAMPGWKQDVGRAVDALIERAVPDVRKAVRWNTPFYGVEGQGWFLGFHCLTRYVKVSFLNGSSLEPLPPIDGKAPGARYLHLHEGDALDEALLTSWLTQAASFPGAPLF